jgi:ABC-type transport system, involved in lipoprotein release, permease component
VEKILVHRWFTVCYWWSCWLFLLLISQVWPMPECRSVWQKLQFARRMAHHVFPLWWGCF